MLFNIIAFPKGSLILGFLSFALVLSAKINAATIMADTMSGVPQGAQDVSLVVSMNTGVNQSISSLQFDLLFDAGPLTFIQAVPGPSAVEAEKEVTSSTVGSGVVRVLVAGLNQNVIQDGNLLSLLFSVAPAASPGTYPISLAQVLAVSPTGLPVPVSGVSGAIEVIVAAEITLTARPRRGRPPLAVLFHVSSNIDSAEVLLWRWEFGDGTTFESNDTSVEHLYLADGAYDVTVSAVTGSGTVTTTFPGFVVLDTDLPLDTSFYSLVLALYCWAGVRGLMKRKERLRECRQTRCKE